MSNIHPKFTRYDNLRLTMRKPVEHFPGVDKVVRPKAGNRALKKVLAAAEAGNTVSMRSDYDDDGCEFMTAEIIWDADND